MFDFMDENMNTPSFSFMQKKKKINKLVYCSIYILYLLYKSF